MTTNAHKSAYALALALVASLSFTTTASADAGQGAFRLGADVPVLGLQHFPGDFGSYTTFQFGLWSTNVARPQVGASIAFQIIEPLVIGARAGFGALWTETGPADSTSGVIALVPFLEYMFGDGTIRPFIGGQAGFQIFFPDGGDAQGWFVGGGLGGVHIFATPGFSISPTLMLDFLYRGDAERAGFGMTGLVTLNGWIN